MKYANLIKLAAVGAILVGINFFVLDYFKEGEITYRTFILVIAGIFIVRGVSWGIGWMEKQRMTYYWLEEQKMTQSRALEKN